MSFPYEQKNVPLAKALRRNATKWERRLWYGFLARCHPRFQRQKPIGDYIVDFYCYEAKLVIELDGRYHQDPETSQNDLIRQKALGNMGLLVMRFSNDQIQNDFPAVCEEIRRAVEIRVPKGTIA